MSFYESEVEKKNYFYFNNTLKKQETPPHFHGAIELIFCVNGEQEVCICGEKKILKRGEGYFCDSYAVHSLKPSGAEVYVVLGDKQFFEPVFSAFGGKNPPTFFQFKDFEFLSVLYKLYQKKIQNEGGRVETNKAIVQLLLTRLNETFAFIYRKADKQNDLVAEILRYASEHYADDLSLRIISSRFGYSREYLSRILHRYLGMHWSIYVGGLRARAAHAILNNNPNISVLTVAMQCGFESANTFYRAYHREFGKAPLQK